MSPSSGLAATMEPLGSGGDSAVDRASRSGAVLLVAAGLLTLAAAPLAGSTTGPQGIVLWAAVTVLTITGLGLRVRGGLFAAVVVQLLFWIAVKADPGVLVVLGTTGCVGLALAIVGLLSKRRVLTLAGFGMTLLWCGLALTPSLMWTDDVSRALFQQPLLTLLQAAIGAASAIIGASILVPLTAPMDEHPQEN